MPFRTRPDQPRDLAALVEHEVRERIEEAVDRVSLEVMVHVRRARALPAPAADSPRDREEFMVGVRTFLERLDADLRPALSPEQQRQTDEAQARAGNDSTARLISVQVALAKDLPDYWQRFEATRTAYTAAQIESGGERSGLFGWLFGR